MPLVCHPRLKRLAAYLSPRINYKGWWTFPELGRLGKVAPLTMTYQQFLARCKDIFAVFEGLKSGPLRSLLRRLGIPTDQIKEEGLKLSASLCQLAAIAKKEHWSLIGDAQEVVKTWDKDARLDFYKAIFALNGLRLADAHALSVGDPTAQASNLKVFDIESDNLKPAGDSRSTVSMTRSLQYYEQRRGHIRD